MTDTWMKQALVEGYRKDTEDNEVHFQNNKRLNLIIILCSGLILVLFAQMSYQIYNLITPEPWYVRLFPFLM